MPPGTLDDSRGLEMAGEVAAVVERVTQWGAGNGMMALLGGDGYGSRLVVHDLQGHVLYARATIRTGPRAHHQRVHYRARTSEDTEALR